MKRYFIFLLTAAVLMAGCMSAPKTDSTVSPELRTAEPIPETTEGKDPTLAALAAYEHILEDFYNNHMSPDGQELWMEDNTFGTIDENHFAISDVDGDGSEELVIVFGTAPMAGMCEWVYGYDADSDAVYQELSVFPNVQYFTNGLLEAGWSHNQGLAGEALWPYSIMAYDSAARTYQVIAQVDAWDSNLRDTDYDGNPFPKELDTDNTGVLYLITTQTEAGLWETDSVSRSVYEAWRAGILGDATTITLEYLNTTLDNIHTVNPLS